MTIENLKMPVGRIVGGNITSFAQAIDYYTKQPKLDKNGNPVNENRVDIAYPKQEFLEKVWPLILREVSAVYPQYANTHPDTCDQTRFAWKIINGDSISCPQGSNVPYNTRDGYAGHYIVKIRTSAFLPGTYKFENGAYRKIEANEVKNGDYVVANVNVTCHKEKDGGLYWNPNGYELVGYGAEIKSSVGADPMALFGGQSYQLPAGASMTPTSSAPATAQMPLTAPVTSPSLAAPITPMQQVPQAPQVMPAPAYDFVANAGMPTAPVAMPQAPVASQAQVVPQGGQPFNSLLNDRVNF